MISSFDKTALRTFEFWASVVVFVATGIFVAPVAKWIAQDALAKEQIQHPFIVLAFAAVMLLQYHRLRLRPSLKIDNIALFHLGMCYVCAGLAYYADIVVIAALPLVFYLAALTRFLFGAKHYRLAKPLLVAFAAFLLLAIYLPNFDWPMRSLAGKASAWSLEVLGFDSTLSLDTQGPEPMWILTTGGRHFLVAPECNGYGMLSSALLACIVTMMALKASWRRLILAAALSLGIAFALNVTRIIAITQLARPFQDRYLMMHEIVGNVALFSCLYLVWRICLLLARWKQSALRG